jgi:glutamate-1-semialdehyde 2,1-aminomutase
MAAIAMERSSGRAVREQAIQSAMHELVTQPWVGELFSEILERQAASDGLVQRLRPLSAASHAFRPFLAPPLPIALASARGAHITDVDGNDYVDCHLGFSAQALHGHNPAPVVEYVRDRLRHGVGNGNLHPIELELAELLRELLPHCETFGFLNSGSDAVRAALRLARAATGRRMVAKFEGAIHGSDQLAVQNSAFWYHGQPLTPFPPVTDDGVAHLSCDAGVPAASSQDLLVLPNDADAAIDLIERHAQRLACVLAEPAASAFPFEDATVPIVRTVALACRRLGIPFVLDEVLTGFRNGIGGAAQRHDIPADLYCYGKVLSGLGIPLSAVGGRADLLRLTQTEGISIFDAGQKSQLPGTHTGNHLALCASFASLSLLRDQGPAYYDQTRAKVGFVRERLERFRAEHGIPLRLVGFGDFMGAFQFLPKDSYDDYREFAESAHPALFLLTLLLRRRGVYMLSSPLFFTGGAHAWSDVETVVDAVTDSALELQHHSFPFTLSFSTAA